MGPTMTAAATVPLLPPPLLRRLSSVAAAAAPRLKIPAATAPGAGAVRGVRRVGGVGRRRKRRCRAAVVEEAGAQEDGVLFPKEGDDAAAAAAAGRYDWKEEWYPLYLAKEVPDDAALPLTVFDRQLVLWRDGDGVLRCHEDRCPHRLAKLSEGQIVDGRLECLYHGWQFDGEGKCVKIPQGKEYVFVANSDNLGAIPQLMLKGDGKKMSCKLQNEVQTSKVESRYSKPKKAHTIEVSKLGFKCVHPSYEG